MHKPNIGGSTKVITTLSTRELEGARVNIIGNLGGNAPGYVGSVTSFQQMLLESERQGMTLREFEKRLALRGATPREVPSLV